MTMAATRKSRGCRASAPEADRVEDRLSVLEGFLRGLVALSGAGGLPPRALMDNGFDSWEDDESTYLEARLSMRDLPDIDLCCHEDRVVIRITRPFSSIDCKDDDEHTGRER